MACSICREEGHTKRTCKKSMDGNMNDNREKYIKSGGIIPLCINTGCGREVAIRHWTKEGLPSLKSECTRCSSARKKNKLIEGVTVVKKTYCQNSTNETGWSFTCPLGKIYNRDTNEEMIIPSDVYEIDHKDGDHQNNVPENVVTVCSVCHTLKGKLSNDFNSNKSSGRKAQQK